MVVALLLGGALGGVASRTLFTSTPSAAPVLSTPGATVPSTTPSPTVPGTDPSSGSSGSSSGSGTGSGTELSSWAEVSSAVNPGVVNIETRLPSGIGAGTGMILTDTGEVLTNNHVVEGATQIVVTVTSTRQSYSATIVGTDPSEDVAVIQMNGASGLTTIPIGDSDSVRVGDEVAAIGNAGGQGGDPILASGQVTALHQQITASDQDGSNAETLQDLIQVAAEVVPGDSGGPLANTKGQVIGMDTAASIGAGAGGGARFRATSNVGFAIPINHALEVAARLVAEGGGDSSTANGSTSTSGGFLGVQVQQAISGGAEIIGVESGSPAESAGLAAGDLISAVDGTTVEMPSDLVTALGEHQAGDTVVLTVTGTDGRSGQIKVTLASR